MLSFLCGSRRKASTLNAWCRLPNANGLIWIAQFVVDQTPRILEILGISDVENPSGRVPFAMLSDLIGRNNIIRWWLAKFI